MTIIRNVREEKGLTIKEVSRISNIPIKTLYHIETGKKGIVENRAFILARLLEQPVEKLFFPTYYRAKLE